MSKIAYRRAFFSGLWCDCRRSRGLISWNWNGAELCNVRFHLDFTLHKLSKNYELLRLLTETLSIWIRWFIAVEFYVIVHSRLNFYQRAKKPFSKISLSRDAETFKHKAIITINSTTSDQLISKCTSQSHELICLRISIRKSLTFNYNLMMPTLIARIAPNEHHKFWENETEKYSCLIAKRAFCRIALSLFETA